MIFDTYYKEYPQYIVFNVHLLFIFLQEKHLSACY